MFLKIFKTNILFILIFTSTLLSQNCSIKIKVTSINGITGILSIGLYNNPKGFPEKNYSSIGTDLVVTNKSMEYTFTNLKKGEYAIAVYHDDNSNGKLDKNFLGIPIEDYVFSNYATGNFGPPSFSDAKFTLVDSMKVTLDLQSK